DQRRRRARCIADDVRSIESRSQVTQSPGPSTTTHHTMTQRAIRPLPLELDAIDRDWLTAALRTRAPGVTVDAVSVVDINRGTCTKVRLRLQMDAAGRRAGIPETVILKGGFEPHSRKMWYMHESEVRAYRDLIPELGPPSPACYFADYDDQTQ